MTHDMGNLAAHVEFANAVNIGPLELLIKRGGFLGRGESCGGSNDQGARD
jgi:hypothetical protein